MPEGVSVRQSMQKSTTRAPGGILTLSNLEVGCYVVFLVALTAASHVAANSRCFNPAQTSWALQNPKAQAYEQRGMGRQLEQLEYLRTHPEAGRYGK